MPPEITVLHVDDDEAFRALLRDFFAHEFDHISVVSASGGANALEQLASRADVDCLVSDYEMPGMDGLDLLERVRERWPTLPFILFTGRGDEGTATRAITLGVSDYLQKRSGVAQYAILANRISNLVARSRAEAALRAASQRTAAQFELLVETVTDYAIFLLDCGGYVQTWNRGAHHIKGYTEAEIVGEHFSIFYRDDDVAAGVPERILREAAAGGRVHEQGWRVRQDGSEFWADVTVTAIHADGELVGYAKITKDDTHRYRERLLFEQHERLQSRVAAISHDLRRPLSVVEGVVQLAIETGDCAPLDGAKRALDRATELLDHLVVLAEEGQALMDPEPVDLRAVTLAAWEAVGTDGVDLRLEGDCTLVADPTRLQQLLENLLENSVDHGSADDRTAAQPGEETEARSPNGENASRSDDGVDPAADGFDVVVRVGPLDGRGFYVSDDGLGIPDAERASVFETGRSSDPERAGFGLAVSRGIADAHGWTIDVTDGVDGGARFEVSNVEVL